MKEKICDFCGGSGKLWFSNPSTCMKYECRNKAQEQRSIKSGTSTPDKKDNRTTSSIKPKKRKVTGEYQLFLKIYAERNATCAITGQMIPFNVNSFAHILSKGAYPSLRLEPDNIIMVLPEIHHMYDSGSRELLLQRYPKAEIIYQLKDRLRYKYYNE